MLTKSTLTYSETVAAYRDMLDECYPETKIGASTFRASHILYHLDRMAYNCGLADYIIELEDEGYVILWEDEN